MMNRKNIVSLYIVCALLFGGKISAEILPIPLQYELTDPRYQEFSNYAARFVGNYTSECARFVNRIFKARFGQELWGNAWDMQLNKINQKWLTLKWQLPEDEFLRQKNFQLKASEDRSKHFSTLYENLDQEKYPIGVLGFFYKYSFWKDPLLEDKNLLPQTHVSFLAGRKQFPIKNETNSPRKIRGILSDQWGEIFDFEEALINERLNAQKNFVEPRISLETELAPGEQAWYQDYYLEEQFRIVRAGSLLESFLRKHRNNRVSSLLRPVSYSQISAELIQAIQAQEKLDEK